MTKTAKPTIKKILTLVVALTLALGISAGWQGETASAATKGTYWLKVNKRACVVTAYQKVKGKWKPVRAMRCSPGKASTPSLTGNYTIHGKWRWLNMNGCWGQYVSQISGDYLFHSVWYYSRSKSRQNVTEFNKLGRPASHGCVRLATIDAKWIYDHCKRGTKVTLYSSSKKGPLGKPKAIKSSSGWDPTDPSIGNPNFKLRKAVLKVKKPGTVVYGKAFKLKKGVTARNKNANENITSAVKVASVKKWNAKKKKYVRAKFSTKQLGKYKITYTAKTKYCPKGTKTYTVKVVDSAPKIIGARTRTVDEGTADLMEGITASSAAKANLNSKVKVTVKNTDTGESKTYSAKKARKLSLDPGTYKVTYKITTSGGTAKTKAKTLTVNALPEENQAEATEDTAS